MMVYHLDLKTDATSEDKYFNVTVVVRTQIVRCADAESVASAWTTIVNGMS